MYYTIAVGNVMITSIIIYIQFVTSHCKNANRTSKNPEISFFSKGPTNLEQSTYNHDELKVLAKAVGIKNFTFDVTQITCTNHLITDKVIEHRYYRRTLT